MNEVFWTVTFCCLLGKDEHILDDDADQEESICIIGLGQELRHSFCLGGVTYYHQYLTVVQNFRLSLLPTIVPVLRHVVCECTNFCSSNLLIAR